ncbi:MAG: hypothetical protein KDB46_02590 [Solirubrobacterales bacterium]|nr:hypothetical protein [Solirubrobacterales bacterium]
MDVGRAGAAMDEPRAEAIAAELIEESAGLRSCALIGPGGEVLAATAANDWAEQSSRIWEAASDPDRPPPVHVHVGIDGGEVFAVRGEHASAIGIADRFSLASLVLCDLRDALRRLGPVAP